MRILGLLLVLSACSPAVAAKVLKPVPRVYSQWWKEVEQCAHLQGAFKRIRWFVLPGESFACAAVPHGSCIGLWQDHNIILAEERLRDPVTVKHEMLHDLIPGGDGLHESPLFHLCAGEPS